MKIFFVLLILILIDIYFYFGTSSVVNFSINNIKLYKFIYWIVSLLIYTAIIYVILTYEKKTPSIRFNDSIFYSSLVFIIFISKFIGLFPLIIDDIIRFFKYLSNTFSFSNKQFDSSRLDFLKKSSLAVSGVIFSTLFLGMLFGRYNFKKNFQNIFIKRWSKNLSGYKIVHISDLHLGSFNSIEKLEEVVDLINEEKADLVVFTGDLVNNYYHEAVPYIDTLKKIKAKDGKFSILGNHDYCDYVGWKRESDDWKDNFSKLLDVQRKAGFQLLRNENTLIKNNKDSFNLVGVENWGAGNFNKDGDLDLAMKNVDKKIPTILLSHDPSHWRLKVLSSPHIIDLQLSGHTHGMQFGIEIPFFKWSPVKYRYKEWAGLYKSRNSQIYVNRGLGHLGYAGRVGIMPDISVLTINS